MGMTFMRTYRAKGSSQVRSQVSSRVSSKPAEQVQITCKKVRRLCRDAQSVPTAGYSRLTCLVMDTVDVGISAKDSSKHVQTRPTGDINCALLTASVPPSSWYLRLLLRPMCSDQHAALPRTLGGSLVLT